VCFVRFSACIAGGECAFLCRHTHSSEHSGSPPLGSSLGGALSAVSPHMSPRGGELFSKGGASPQLPSADPSLPDHPHTPIVGLSASVGDIAELDAVVDVFAASTEGYSSTSKVPPRPASAH
jgi:hypothetical protein